jgi:hypothetical protein
MIDAAFASLLLISIICRNIPVLFFVCICILHDVIFGAYEGFAYYGTAAMFDYLVLLVMRRSFGVQLICLVSIIFNMFGYMDWFLYLPPTLYDYSLLFLYMITAVVCAQGGGDGFGDGGGGTGFRANDSAFSAFYFKSEVRL